MRGGQNFLMNGSEFRNSGGVTKRRTLCQKYTETFIQSKAAVL